MSALSMTREEREAFLADVHVGVIGISAGDRSPLTVPIWYLYEPGGLLTIRTGEASEKGRLLQESMRFSLATQTETPPYKYVSVEGQVASWEAGGSEDERKAMAYRYLGQELGDMYLAATTDEQGGTVTVRMQPERWLTVDYGKQFG